LLALAVTLVAAGAQATHPTLEYAPAGPAGSNGHKLDLYLPAGGAGTLPVVIWTGGSAWLSDGGKGAAGPIAAQLNPAGSARMPRIIASIPVNGFLTSDSIREVATMRSTSSAGSAVTNPAPYTPTWKTITDF